MCSHIMNSGYTCSEHFSTVPCLTEIFCMLRIHNLGTFLNFNEISISVFKQACPCATQADTGIVALPYETAVHCTLLHQC